MKGGTTGKGKVKEGWGCREGRGAKKGKGEDLC